MNFLADFAIKSAFALSIAFGIAFAMRRSSASVRYALWTCALAALLVLPFVSWIAPRWTLHRGAATVVEQQASVSLVVHAGSPRPAPEWPRTLPMAVWMAGAIAMLARIAAGHWRARSLFGSAETVTDPEWTALSCEIAAKIGFRRRVILKRSAATDVPLSYGLSYGAMRAIVLVPADAEHWTRERRRIVLAHEMIHACRLDSLWGLMAQCALALNWFNPLAWLAAKRFRREQERSCDDAVVSAGTASTVYAAHLVDLARAIAIPEPALGMAEAFELEGRIHSLLDGGRNRKAASRKLCAAMFAGALAIVAPLAAVRAQSTGKASMLGAVYDPSGAVVPNATISLQNAAGSDVEFAEVNSAGAYRLPAILAGEYLVKVMAPGFSTYQKKVTLLDGAPSRLDVHLTIGEVKEFVEIAVKRAQSAAGSAEAPKRMRVGGMVQAVRLISRVNPAYPADARAEGVEGTVVLRAIVSKDGGLLRVTPVSTGVDARLVSAAMAAVPLWRYEPAQLNGEPVEVITTVTMAFRLD